MQWLELAVAALRTPWLYLASYVPAAITLNRSPLEFKQQMMERLADGTITVLKIQKMVSALGVLGRACGRRALLAPQFGAGKSAAMDWIMCSISNLCDGDFYFIVCPLLFW
jgi:hypothetical protein